MSLYFKSSDGVAGSKTTVRVSSCGRHCSVRCPDVDGSGWSWAASVSWQAETPLQSASSQVGGNTAFRVRVFVQSQEITAVK